ncbi:FAD-dependent oxidoreductase, partial [Burkholderia ubonensis]|uniref:FAD-dependent oxidoreductase n=1 Tax=Burkholderia ubonensis TaxID=101571 RepID=UPI000B0FB4EE
EASAARPAGDDPSLDGALDVDVCVIGAGFAGLSTALDCRARGLSVAENAMFRFKTLTGNGLLARRSDSQVTEVALRVGVLNHMTALAHPQSVRIA